MTRRHNFHAPTASFLVVAGLIYLSLLILFAWQTLEFVWWLFPDQSLIYRVMTFVCFDVLALVWACGDMFGRFIHETARTWIRWGWIIDYLLSGVATILFLSIQGYYRSHLPVTDAMLNGGYTVSLVALVFNMAILTGFLYNEILAILEARTHHQRYVRRKQRNVTHNAVTGVTQQQLAQNASVTHNVTPLRSRNAVRQQRYRQRRKGQFLP